MNFSHSYFIRLALEEAKTAGEQGEVPIGALVVLKNEVIGRGCNFVESGKNPLLHAEMEAMKYARNNIDGKWFTGATLYCTLEPCLMCAGAAVLNRFERIVFGASDPNWGACGTLYNIPLDNRLNHRIEVVGGIMEAECGELLRRFFAGKR
ncbi:MAG: nucleoside deaminase [candidate division Zixibacteria bacterium]|nr:nucleoside deaminase [Candidatus Tariuqbacter arcticus]